MTIIFFKESKVLIFVVELQTPCHNKIIIEVVFPGLHCAAAENRSLTYFWVPSWVTFQKHSEKVAEEWVEQCLIQDWALRMAKKVTARDTAGAQGSPSVAFILPLLAPCSPAWGRTAAGPIHAIWVATGGSPSSGLICRNRTYALCPTPISQPMRGMHSSVSRTGPGKIKQLGSAFFRMRPRKPLQFCRDF